MGSLPTVRASTAMGNALARNDSMTGIDLDTVWEWLTTTARRSDGSLSFFFVDDESVRRYVTMPESEAADNGLIDYCGDCTHVVGFIGDTQFHMATAAETDRCGTYPHAIRGSAADDMSALDSVIDERRNEEAA